MATRYQLVLDEPGEIGTCGVGFDWSGRGWWNAVWGSGGLWGLWGLWGLCGL
ncbi:MAG: hypothetical protein IT435_03415 [Phycisphaerales bacterium]|nr:hypothetical protein [Phycisphaerales bacterium]